MKISRHRKLLAILPFVGVAAVYLIHNGFYPNSVAGALTAYFIYFLSPILFSLYVLVRSAVQGNKLTGRHSTTRFWGMNGCCIMCLLVFGMWGYDLVADLNEGLVTSCYTVKDLRNSYRGAFVLDHVTFQVKPGQLTTLSLLMRNQIPEIGQSYRIIYATKAELIITIEKCNSRS